MIKKSLVFIILFCVIALLTTSFLVHFDFLRSTSSMILTLFTIFSFVYFARQKKYLREWQRICCEFSPAFGIGFFWDIFSGSFLGFHVLILLALIVFVKFIFKNYIQFPIYG